MQWLNEPPVWQDDAGTLSVETAAETDFWRRTHYGFIHENGHLRYEEIAGDFLAEVRFDADYQAQYDQAGLMLMVDDEHWIKSGIEFVEGRYFLSAVVTNRFSDWSVIQLTARPKEVRVRIGRRGSAIEAMAAVDDGDFQMLRLAYLPEGSPVRIGPMCCSPSRAGLRVRFHDFSVRPLLPDEPFGH